MKKKLILIIVFGVLLLIQSLQAQTWNVTKRLTFNSGSSKVPAIDVNSNNHIHVVWSDDSSGNWEIFHKKSTNGGTTWTSKRLTFNPGDTYSADIAINSSNHLHVVWDNDTSGNWEIYPRLSTDGGATWTSKRLTYNSGSSAHPAIAIDSSDNLHVVWDDSTPGTGEIYHKKSTDGGATWTTKRLTYNSGGSYYPSISVDSSDNLHAAWHDYTPGNSEIFYKQSTNGGSTWTTKRLTYNSGNSGIPAIAIGANDHIHVVWQDDSPGDFEIYYKKGIQ